MSKLERKMKLDVVFNRIILKIYRSTNNLTNQILPIDFLRKDIKTVFYVSVAIELKSILASLLCFNSKEIDLSLLLDLTITSSLISSKKRCIQILHLSGKNNLGLSNPWLISQLKKDELGTGMVLLRWIVAKKENNSLPLIMSLIENFIIRLTNIMVFELFSNESFSRGVLLCYTTDYFSFYYNINNLKLSLYWKSYLGNFYYLLKNFYRRSHLISVYTKKGIVLKNVYTDNLTCKNIVSEKYTVFLTFLNFFENTIMEFYRGF